MSSPDTPTVYLIAGEASGDALGAGLMRALKVRTGGKLQFCGIGGPRMTSEGLKSLFPMEDLAVMGLAEVLPRLPTLLRRIGEAQTDIEQKRPDVLVTIDSPDFCFRVARKVKAADPGLPIVHYVAPTVWAWRAGRDKKVARFLNHILCLYPFEPPYFEAEGLSATFIGHPIAGKLQAPSSLEASAADFRARHGIPDEAQVLAVLPGSRSGELDRHLPVFGRTLEKLADGGWRGQVVLPTLERHLDRLRQETADWASRPIIVPGEDEKWLAFAAADAALAASGTVTLELAAAGVPSIVAYRVSALTAAIGRRMIKVDHVGLVNVLLKEEVMPEFLQDDCTPEQLAPALADLLESADKRGTQKEKLRLAMEMLRAPDGDSDAAAAAVIAGYLKAS